MTTRVNGDRPLIYVSGPITLGDQFANVRRALDVAQELLRAGFAPIVPHLSYAWHMVHPNDYEVWMDYDFACIRKCDGLIRISGESKGADREVEFARSLDMPVFDSVHDVCAYWPTGDK